MQTTRLAFDFIAAQYVLASFFELEEQRNSVGFHLDKVCS